MLIYAGVYLDRLDREIRRALQVASDVVEETGDEIVVTSTYESNHMAGSLHYANRAFDFIGRYNLKQGWSDTLSKRLGDDFDVVWEWDHIHVEYDPD